MFATSFQLAGALLLGYMIAFRRKKDIIIVSSISVLLKGKKPLIAKDKWIETFGYRIGFLYLAIGYLLPVIEKDIGIPSIEKVFLICFVSLILIVIGAAISEYLGERSFNKMTYEDFHLNAPDGALMIDPEDTSDPMAEK